MNEAVVWVPVIALLLHLVGAVAAAVWAIAKIKVMVTVTEARLEHLCKTVDKLSDHVESTKGQIGDMRNRVIRLEEQEGQIGDLRPRVVMLEEKANREGK